MNKLLLIEFAIALIILIISGTGFFLPGIIAILILAIKGLLSKFNISIPFTPVAKWKTIGICYSANFILMIINLVL